MNRNRHKRCHEKGKFKKKFRVHEIKYEKGSNGFDDVEKNIKNSVWSRWVKFFRGHWGKGEKKATSPLDAYSGAVSADILEIPVEPENDITETKNEIYPRCADDVALCENKSYCITGKGEEEQKQEQGQEPEEQKRRLVRTTGSLEIATGRRNLPTSELCFPQSVDQMIRGAEIAVPSLWTYKRESMSLNKSSQKGGMLKVSVSPELSQMSPTRARDQILQLSGDEDINKTLSEPTWNEKAKIYHRRQMQADINSLFDQLMCIHQDFYMTEFIEQEEKEQIKFDSESISRTGSLPQKISRQVSPQILVNIKPFKKRITQNDLAENFSVTAPGAKFNLNQIKKTKRVDQVDLQAKGIVPESEQLRFRYPELQNQIAGPCNLWDTGKGQPILRKETPRESRMAEGSLKKDFCFVFGVYRSYKDVRGESGEKSLDEVLESFDDRDHNAVFKKNLRQFRKKITCVSIEEEEEETRRLGKGAETHPDAGTVKVKNIFTTKRVLGVHCGLITRFNYLRTVFYTRKQVHVVTVLQTVREICQFRESCWKGIFENKFSHTPQSLAVESSDFHVHELKTGRSFHEIKQCLKNVEKIDGVFPKKKDSNNIFTPQDCLTAKQSGGEECQNNLTDLLGFLQQYSDLVEKSCTDNEFSQIEKILSTVVKRFSSLGLIETDSEFGAAAVNISIAMEKLAENHRVVKILNGSAPEYLAFIYQNLSSKNYSEKSFSESDLHKRRRQAMTVHSEANLVEDSDGVEFGQPELRPTFSIDGFRILYNGMESLSDDDEDALKRDDSGTEKTLDHKRKEYNLITSIEERKMLTFKSNSFPGEIAAATDYRGPRSRNVSKELHKDFKKKRKPVEKMLETGKRVNPGHLESEKLFKIESDSAKFRKYLLPENLNRLKGNESKKMFFIEKNAGQLGKEVIAAFSTIKDLSDEKDSAKTSVVIMLSRK